jgi:hypothetical protein
MAYGLQLLDYRLDDWGSGLWYLMEGTDISLVLYFRTGSLTHRAFYPVRIRGSVPGCRASSVATNSSSPYIRLYGDTCNLRLLLRGKVRSLFFWYFGHIPEEQGPCMELLFHCAICLYGVCVCVHKLRHCQPFPFCVLSSYLTALQ